jgi:hypothetical protein
MLGWAKAWDKGWGFVRNISRLCVIYCAFWVYLDMKVTSKIAIIVSADPGRPKPIASLWQKKGESHLIA